MDELFGGFFGGGRKQPADPELAKRLPPGQVLTAKWPVLTYGPTPGFDPKTWTFEVRGLVKNPIRLGYEEFMALPAVDVMVDIHCVTRWSRFDNVFTGVPYRVIEEMVEPLPEARSVMQFCDGGYTTNTLLEDLRADNVVLAYKHDGEFLTPEHGFPLRSVVPHLYFWKSAKWLRGFHYMDKDAPGFWEQYGYHLRGDPFREERYS